MTSLYRGRMASSALMISAASLTAGILSEATNSPPNDVMNATCSSDLVIVSIIGSHKLMNGEIKVRKTNSSLLAFIFIRVLIEYKSLCACALIFIMRSAKFCVLGAQLCRPCTMSAHNTRYRTMRHCNNSNLFGKCCPL